MRFFTRSFIAASLALAAVPAAIVPAGAQEWPARPIRVVVNVPPGGGIDRITRVFATRLGETLGQPVVVENRAGAGGNIGVEVVVKSAPDGYTLLSAIGSTVVMGSHLYKLNFDMSKDIVPVAPIARTHMFLVVRNGLPVNSVRELVAYARAHPGKLNFGSPGVGTGPHIAAEMALRAAKIQATHVPYKGSAQTLTALISDEIDFAFDPGSAVRQAQAGRLRLLGVASARRTSIAPDTPTLAESGVDVDASTVHGLYAPAGTPREIVDRLAREMDRIMKTPEVLRVIASVTAEPVYATPDQFAQQLQRDRERFGVIIRETNIRAD